MRRVSNCDIVNCSAVRFAWQAHYTGIIQLEFFQAQRQHSGEIMTGTDASGLGIAGKSACPLYSLTFQYSVLMVIDDIEVNRANVKSYLNTRGPANK